MAKAKTIHLPERWDRPFGPDMTDEDVDRVVALRIFENIDESAFPASQAFRDIIKNDARLVTYQRGDIVVREGDYGSSVFVIMRGQAAVILDTQADDKKERRLARRQRTFGSAFAQLWTNAKMPGVRDIASYDAETDLNVRTEADEKRAFIPDVDSFLAKIKIHTLNEGQNFGEIAALSRTPRTATVVAKSDLEMVEMRWQGLREIRRRDNRFRELIDRLYRERSLSRHLGESPLLSHLDESTLEMVAAKTIFETHGDFDWWSSYKRLASKDSEEVLKQEPVIAEQGVYVDGLIMVRSGFARITQRLDHGERTVGYASTNDVFGLDEIVHHWRDGGPLRLGQTLRAIGYVDILRVPTAMVEEHILPTVPAHLLPEPLRSKSTPAWQERGDEALLSQSLFDFLVDNRTINGTQTMLINTDRCTGCDDCVRACSSTHNNNPRFVRHGPVHGNLQVTNACMHCTDPVCLIGCPTGAIGRNAADGRVMIDDRTCIGCGTCANSCPYNNIRLVEIRDEEGNFILDSESNVPIVKVTKCDLCFGQFGGPACQRACPHDALIRINMNDQQKLAEWVNR